MSFKCGIVGLPNVGKSTLFNALTNSSKAQAANFPFCTIDPNVGVVPVPDQRLENLAKISKSKKIINTTIEFVDIAGLVKGASKGEGLGNAFLSHIRSVNALFHIVRCFEDDDIQHVENRIDPLEDIKIINAELALQDPSQIEDDSISVSPLAGFNFGLASSIGFVNGEAISDVPLGGTFVISTPFGAKVGPLDLTVSLGVGGYTGNNDNGTELNPFFAGIGANGVLSELVFSETHIGIVSKGFGFRQFAGITLERIMKKGLNLPFNILIGGEGFLSTDIEGSGVSTYWGGLGVRLDYSF